MKVTIAYLPSEDRKAATIKACIKHLLPGVKVRESERHAPYKHIYFSTRKSTPVDGQTGS
jgi:hypothetical protein